MAHKQLETKNEDKPDTRGRAGNHNTSPGIPAGNSFFGLRFMNAETDETLTADLNGKPALVSSEAKDMLLLRRLAFSVRETAEMLGISEKTVRRLIRRGLLRPSRALRHLLIPKKEIERFLEQTTAK
jgi:excisionase family DNA binding protein